MLRGKKNGAFPTPKERANHCLLYLLPQTPLREKLDYESQLQNLLSASKDLRITGFILLLMIRISPSNSKYLCTVKNCVARDLPLSLAPLCFLLCLITPTPIREEDQCVLRPFRVPIRSIIYFFRNIRKLPFF